MRAAALAIRLSTKPKPDLAEFGAGGIPFIERPDRHRFPAVAAAWVAVRPPI
jgi:hypothetical protein